MSTTSSSEKSFPEASNTEPVPAQSSSYPLSPLQQGMLFQWQLDRHSGTDIEQIVGDLYEPIDARRLEIAWNAAVASLATLRTAFEWDGLATPRQHVRPAVELAFAFEDLRSLSDSGAKARMSEFLDRDRREGFDLAHAPAMRVHLFQVADEHFRLVWTVHHILIDGRSFEVVLKAVFNAYDSATPAKDTRPYSEYIEWIERQDLAEPRAFWRAKLAGFSAPTPIPADLQPGGGAAGYGHRSTHLSSTATRQLRELASREGLTLNTLIMSAWGLMLARYSGETDIVFGATKTTRRGTVADADSILGVFLATIPVRLKVDPDLSVLQWLQHVREEWVSLRGFEHLPLVDIRQSSDVRTPRLFDTLFVFENFSFGKRLTAQGGAWSARHFGILEQTGFPLTLAGYGDDELALKVEYDASRFSAPMIDIMLGHLTTLLQRWTGDTSVPLWSASMLTDAEERLVVRDWNATAVAYPRDAFIHELFADEATRRPEAIAAQYQGASITYGELNASANVLAARLAREGVGVGDCVGVFADRSIEYIVACIAILKAGAAYLPFEPGYPTDRMLFMIGDADARVVLTPRQFAPEFEGCVSGVASPPRVVVIDAPDASAAALDDAPGASAVAVARGDDAGSRAAYVMYTSGSSGQPKGVAVPHRAVVRLARNSSVADYQSTDVMLSIATTMFDASTWEMWSVLLNGGRLAVLPAGQIDLGQLSDLVQSAGVTMLLNTAALFQQVVEFGLQPFNTVRLFLIGGDVVPVPQLRRAVAALPGCQFVNAYGPTENAVMTTAYAVPMGRPIEDPLPIGPPISNSTAYVLNSHGSPSAIGEPGELYTGGDGVAVGYVNRPELTAERFLPDPFSREPGARMYRTGDAARWRSDGVIEYLGRLDNQVKIRGYRIEPGEVEAAMGELAGVRSAAVAVRKDSLGQKRLLGYYVPIEGSALTPAGVRQALRATLPDYMVPVSIMALAELPQTNSGKIDRKALPEPTPDENANIEAGFRSRPLGRSQRQLAKIWEELLGRTSVGVDDDFFEIGGHSLLAVRMMGEVERALGRRLALTSLLERPTIRHLAKLVDAAMLGEPEPAMVVLQPEGTATPFVFVHGDLTGGGWYCRRLSSLIGENVPLIVMPTFRPPANGESWTIETMAEMHVRELRKVQAKGPYRIGGFCAGGLIALEIARLLVAAGETVEHLILIDSMNKNSLVFRWRPIIDRLAPPTPDQRRFVQRQNVLRRISYYDSRLRAVTSMGGSELARWAVNTVRIRLPGGRRAEQAASSVPAKDSPGAPEMQAPTRPEREKLLFYARSAAVYVPRRYVGSVDLVFSSDPSDQATNATDPDAAARALSVGYGPIAAGWQSVLPGARVHHIPGMHISMIVDNIDKLGACLRECLGVIDE